MNEMIKKESSQWGLWVLLFCVVIFVIWLLASGILESLVNLINSIFDI